jgi:tetratricopeptide (TPR) repeat protein
MEAGKRAAETAAGESWILANALNLLGSVELERGPSEAARRYFEEALALVEHHEEATVWAPSILNNLGLLASISGDSTEARRWYEATLEALPAEGLPLIRPTVLGNLAWMARDEGDWPRAAALQREALVLQNQLQDGPALAISLEEAAQHAVIGGRSEVAARLLGAAEALRLRGGIAIEPFNVDDHRALIDKIREHLDEPTFATARAEGESLPLDQAIAEADALLAEAAQVGKSVHAT